MGCLTCAVAVIQWQACSMVLASMHALNLNSALATPVINQQFCENTSVIDQ
jgi:hypothetical protein